MDLHKIWLPYSYAIFTSNNSLITKQAVIIFCALGKVSSFRDKFLPHDLNITDVFHSSLTCTLLVSTLRKPTLTQNVLYLWKMQISTYFFIEQSKLLGTTMTWHCSLIIVLENYAIISNLSLPLLHITKALLHPSTLSMTDGTQHRQRSYGQNLIHGQIGNPWWWPYFVNIYSLSVVGRHVGLIFGCLKWTK